ncbi:MAG: glyoxalase/bleomycin resistance/extradiol dioxygenase family protein [Saprospiraceae bacterium]|nr:glyoxalase/bleomycin resistance/extradiol dioxygenase family protein [Saprospiraceae bacterium]MBK7609049.1 glyoxalase/bleomycin resistance/extradiol dioxygenase family protein [Saprospiraceae bacterium]MBK8513074.1 glyoxalase/bleomycin resistance/extradiol dioxygenase family protein [Saprospiraceae bacterium]MBK9928726.1 glyoxalase/bleomycin resistance/extradiol dioxygenase family protein [Saprospiraceae bacterium]MBL0110933.1 glyoxalase/bleomycin resistance/extradiol dioxygenase family pro
MKSSIVQITPVLPSQNIDRDVLWYRDRVGFDLIFKDTMYAVLVRDGMHIHLQWHANTLEDPLLGGSVIRIFVKNIEPIFEEFILRNTVGRDRLRLATPWNTNEFGFYDLNNNAVFIVEDL